MSNDPATSTGADAGTLTVGDPQFGPQHKSVPPSLYGRRASSLADTRVPLSAFDTPVLTLDRGALAGNVRRMTEWTRSAGLHLAPHGKTTMAPALWADLLDAGAWGLTLATGWQTRIALRAGVRRIILANDLVDPAALANLADDLEQEPSAEVIVWADSPAAVRAAGSIFAHRDRALPMLVELGADNGRTGARTVPAALAVADTIRATDGVVLAGVGGYEGALAHDRSAAGLHRVDSYLDEVAVLHRLLAASGAVGGRRAIVTVGGSAFPDRVADRLGALDADVVLRSGAFQVHDDGHYRSVSPFGRQIPGEPLRSAMHAWVHVISRPEPGLAILNGGKRDLSFDEGFPRAQRVVGLSHSASDRILGGSRITAMNDQHTFLRLDETALDENAGERDAAEGDLPVGSVLRLGLSHPCTALDRWRLIPLIEDADAAEPVVSGAVETYF